MGGFFKNNFDNVKTMDDTNLMCHDKIYVGQDLVFLQDYITN